MSKQEIKKQVRDAIKKGRFKDMIRKVSLFGSYVRGEATAKSDVDLLVEFEPEAIIGLFELVDIQQEIEKVLKKKVDLLTSEGISKYLRPAILKEAQLIYEK